MYVLHMTCTGIWYHTNWQSQIDNSRHQKQGKETKTSGTQSQGKEAQCRKIHKTEHGKWGHRYK